MSDIELPKGEGLQLKSIPFIKDALDDPDNQEGLESLHLALFNKTGNAREMKEILYNFCGFPEGSEFKINFETKLGASTLNTLKQIARIVGVTNLRTKSEYTNGIIAALESPKDNGKKYHKRAKKEEPKETKPQTGKMRLSGEDEEEEESGEEHAAEKETKKKTRRSGKDKDPDAPKKPLTAYLLFSKEHQEDIKKELAEKLGTTPSLAQISKVVAERYAALSPEQKQPYIDEYEKNKAEYEKQKQEYISSGKQDEWKANHPAHNDDGEKEGKKKRVTDPNAPKQPPSAYIIFVTANRQKYVEEHSTADNKPSSTDIVKGLGEMWKAMSAEEKQKYEDEAKEKKEQYNKEYSEYVSSGKKDEWEASRKAAEKPTPVAPPKKAEKMRVFKLKKGRVPTEEEMRRWIQQDLDNHPQQESISLKQTRKAMEQECGVNLSQYKRLIEQIVSKLTEGDEA